MELFPLRGVIKCAHKIRCVPATRRGAIQTTRASTYRGDKRLSRRRKRRSRKNRTSSSDAACTRSQGGARTRSETSRWIRHGWIRLGMTKMAPQHDAHTDLADRIDLADKATLRVGWRSWEFRRSSWPPSSKNGEILEPSFDVSCASEKDAALRRSPRSIVR